MASTVEAIVLEAFADLGVIQPGDDLSAGIKANALLVFQQMVDSWNLERPMNLVTHQAVTLIAGTSVYTYGSGGTMPITPAPIRVLSWSCKDGNYSTSGVVMPYDEFRQTIKDGASTTAKLIQALTADRGNIISANLIKLEVWPTPAATPGSLTLETIFTLTTPAALATSLSAYGPGFEAAFHFNLAVALAPQYARTGGVTPELAANAQNSKAIIVQASNEIQGLLQPKAA